MIPELTSSDPKYPQSLTGIRTILVERPCRTKTLSFDCRVTTSTRYTLSGLKMTGLVKVTHDGAGGGSSTTEWVHPSVAELFRRKGPAMFDRGALAAADAEAALEAAVRHRAAITQKRAPGAASTAPGGSGKRGSKGQQGKGLDVVSTLRVLENQVLALVEGAGGVSGGGA